MYDILTVLTSSEIQQKCKMERTKKCVKYLPLDLKIPIRVRETVPIPGPKSASPPNTGEDPFPDIRGREREEALAVDSNPADGLRDPYAVSVSLVYGPSVGDDDEVRGKERVSMDGEGQVERYGKDVREES